MPSARILLLTSLIALGLRAPAHATLGSGDTLVYVQTQTSSASGVHLPGAAAKLGGSMTRIITITVTGQNPNGSALVHVKSHKEAPDNLSPAQRTTWEKFSNVNGEFEAQISPEGALLIAQDDMLQPGDQVSAQGLSTAEYGKKIMAQANDAAYQGKVTAMEIATSFSLPDAVVLSLAKRKSNAVGDSWRVVSNPEGHPYDVTITGTQSANGHEILLISANGKYEDSMRSTTTDAKVSWDTVSRLIVSVHSSSTSSMPSRGLTTTLTTQLDLRQK